MHLRSRKYKNDELKDVSPGAANWYRDMLAVLYPHVLRMDTKLSLLLRGKRRITKEKLDAEAAEQDSNNNEASTGGKGKKKGKKSKK